MICSVGLGAVAGLWRPRQAGAFRGLGRSAGWGVRGAAASRRAWGVVPAEPFRPGRGRSAGPKGCSAGPGAFRRGPERSAEGRERPAAGRERPAAGQERPARAGSRGPCAGAVPGGATATRRWHDGTMTENAIPTAEQEVVAICRDLIRIDTTNPGDHSGPGERKAAEYVAGLLAEVGLQPAVLESHPKRTSLVARIEGTDQSRPAPAHPRAPGRRARQRQRLAAGPVRRGDRRWLRLGARRGRHEGHGRDHACGRPAAAARRPQAGP